MQLQRNVSLKPYNTFGIDATAAYFLEVNDEKTFPEISGDKSLQLSRHVLGGGSNVLLTNNVAGLVLLNRTKGIMIEKEDEDHVWLRVASGEVWHEFVMYAIENGWGGIENLALIPGTVGAAPMQNIGAYGVEAKETIEKVTVWHWEDQSFSDYDKTACGFGYRDSIFKHSLKEKVFISSVSFKLNKKHQFNTSYGAISHELEKMGVTELSIKAVAHAVIAIRSSKLPDPKQIGNAGSFFKNPTIGKAQFEDLLSRYEGIPSYPVNDEQVKVPAGWLIEQCGWKGFRRDDTGVHEKQALVLVNYGNAKGAEIWQLSQDILDSVNEKFGIMLEREVQVW